MGYFPPTHTHQSWNRELNAKTQIRYYWRFYPKCVTAKHPGRNIPYPQFAHELRTNEWTDTRLVPIDLLTLITYL